MNIEAYLAEWAAEAPALVGSVIAVTLMVARVMGNDVSARVAPAGAVRVRIGGGKLSATFADLGFPALNMRLQDSPAWLEELAGGGGKA